MADIIVEVRRVAKAVQPHWFVWLADQQILPEEQCVFSSGYSLWF